MDIKQIKSKFLYGSFDQNTYIVSNKSSVIIIDAGADVNDLKKEIGKRDVLGVFITHLHFDHIYNIESILKEFDCPVYVLKGFEEKFSDARKNAAVLIRQNLTFDVKENQIKYYEDEMIVGKFKLKIYKTPGHCADCVWKKIDEH